MIAFKVNVVPKSQPRQRHSGRIGKNKAGKQIVVVKNYTPKKAPVNAFKDVLRLFVRNEYKDKPLDVPLSLTLEFVFPRPKNKVWKNKPMPREPKPTKPDFDNLEKSVCDALNGILWRDDCLICENKTTKWIANGDESPHVFIMVEPLGSRY